MDASPENELVVVLDHDADLAALPAVSPLSLATQAYLRNRDITDERTWAAFRLDQIDPGTQTRFGYGGQRQLRPDHGASVPTFDPRDPGTITGIIRQLIVQNAHRFVTPPVGIAGPVDLIDQPRLVLVANPLTAMRLHQAGLVGVVVVEEITVLEPLLDWFAARQLVIAAHKWDHIERIRTALGAAGSAAAAVILPASPRRLAETVRELLDGTAPPATPPAITPRRSRAIAQVQPPRVDEPTLAAAPAPTQALAPITPPVLAPVLPPPVHPPQAVPPQAVPPQPVPPQAEPPQPVPAEPIPSPAFLPSALLTRLVPFAQARLAAGVGIDRLRALGIDLPHLLADADAGVIPSNFREALPTVDAALVGARDLGNVLLLPATNEVGTVVDAAGIDLADGQVRWSSLGNAPRGLLLPRIPTTTPAVLIVETWANLLRCAQVGHRRVLWLRSEADAAANATRLRQAGITHATLVGLAADHHAAFSSVLTAAGITVDTVASVDPAPVVVEEIAAFEPVPVPAAAPDPALAALVLRRVSYDRETRRAVFAADDLAVVVDLPAAPEAPTEVLLRRDQLQHRDRLHLTASVPCDRFSVAAARRFACPVARIRGILAALPQALAALVDGDDVLPATTLVEDAAAADEAEAALEAADIVDRFDSDLTSLGWIGDPQAKLLALLAIAGRSLDTPPWLHLRGEPSVTMPILARLASCIPPERHIATPGGVLPLRGDVDLRQGVLLLHDSRRLRPDDATALRLLHAHGNVASTGLGRDAAGRLAGRSRSVRGPVTVIAASDAATPLDDLAIVAVLDDSPAQTACVQAAAQAARRHGIDQRALQRIALRWQVIFRRVAPADVVVPCADRIRFPATQPRHRHEHALFLALVDASALLHQRQRQREGDAVVATDADMQTAIDAAQGLLGVTNEGLSQRAAEILAAMRAARLTSVTTPEVAALLPQVPRRSLHHGLEELVRLDLLTASDPGRGRNPRSYHLVPGSAASDGVAIRLEPVLARNGNDDVANIAPVRVAG